MFERFTLILAGLLLVYPKPLFDYIGIPLFSQVIVIQKLHKTVDKPIQFNRMTLRRRPKI